MRLSRKLLEHNRYLSGTSLHDHGIMLVSASAATAREKPLVFPCRPTSQRPPSSREADAESARQTAWAAEVQIAPLSSPSTPRGPPGETVTTSTPAGTAGTCAGHTAARRPRAGAGTRTASGGPTTTRSGRGGGATTLLRERAAVHTSTVLRCLRGTASYHHHQSSSGYHLRPPRRLIISCRGREEAAGH